MCKRSARPSGEVCEEIDMRSMHSLLMNEVRVRVRSDHVCSACNSQKDLYRPPMKDRSLPTHVLTSLQMGVVFINHASTGSNTDVA